MAKQPRVDPPHRVESVARMTVADEPPVQQRPLIREATRDDIVATGLDVLVDAGVPEGTIEFCHPDGRVDRIVNVGRPYYPLDDAAPRDGSLVEGRAEDGTEFMMIWRQTRRYDPAKMQWVQVGFWSGYLDRQPLAKEPVEWRRLEYQNAPPPGAIMP